MDSGATLYLHGFLSSPASHKAQVLGRCHGRAGRRWIAPDLNVDFEQIQTVLLRSLDGVDTDNLAIVGSSLGGFYATWLAEQLPLARVVLLNPAVQPWRFVPRYLGEQKVYGSERTVTVCPELAGQLQAMQRDPVHPGRFLTVFTTGDEVLDWREGFSFYRQAPRFLVQGSTHAIEGFEENLSQDIMRFILAGVEPRSRDGAWLHHES